MPLQRDARSKRYTPLSGQKLISWPSKSVRPGLSLSTRTSPISIPRSLSEHFLLSMAASFSHTLAGTRQQRSSSPQSRLLAFSNVGSKWYQSDPLPVFSAGVQDLFVLFNLHLHSCLRQLNFQLLSCKPALQICLNANLLRGPCAGTRREFDNRHFHVISQSLRRVVGAFVANTFHVYYSPCSRGMRGESGERMRERQFGLCAVF